MDNSLNPAIAEGSIGDFAGQQTSNSPIIALVQAQAPISANTNPYVNLITSEHLQPKFTAIVDLLTRGFWQNTLLLNSFSQVFDLDIATGNALDIIGKWIGKSRQVPTPITDVFFSFNIDGLGFNQGYWSDGIVTEMTILPDEEYRAILKAKVALNQWDGSIPSAINALNLALPNNTFYIIDNQNMSMILGISGPVSIVMEYLLTHGFFDLRPAGVEIAYEATTKFFGWNEETATIGGWTEGSWANLV